MSARGKVGGDGAMRPHRRGEKLYETVARDIVRRIREENLQPGDILPGEAQMLAEYGVGRASLREALRVLEVSGLITIKPGPGGGPVVAGVEAREFARMASLYFQVGKMTFRELMEARLVIEPVMARLAAERRDPRQLEQLDRAASPGEAVELESDADHPSSGADFHEVVAGMSGNRILDLVGTALLEIFHDCVGGPHLPVSRRRGARGAHAEIARAIREGGADRAETLMREHMVECVSSTKRRFPALLDEVVEWRQASRGAQIPSDSRSPPARSMPRAIVSCSGTSGSG